MTVLAELGRVIKLAVFFFWPALTHRMRWVRGAEELASHYVKESRERGTWVFLRTELQNRRRVLVMKNKYSDQVHHLVFFPEPGLFEQYEALNQFEEGQPLRFELRDDLLTGFSSDDASELHASHYLRICF